MRRHFSVVQYVRGRRGVGPAGVKARPDPAKQKSIEYTGWESNDNG